MNYITITFTLLILSFAVISKFIFDYVYDTSQNVIDEQFHIPQGIAYCKGNFSTWDPKITTLPGLYLVSTFLLIPFKICTTYSLRITSLIAAIINLILMACILKEDNKNKAMTWFTVLSSLNISLLPPLYFFGHLYYTDVLSVTFVMSMIFAFKNHRHGLASILGFIALLIRQTNVLWVAMLLGNLLLDLFMVLNGRRNRIKSRLKLQAVTQAQFYNINDFRRALTIFLKRGCTVRDISISDCVNVFSYASVLFGFVVFVFINGGIVVGDKAAHEATVHIPQLFYFSLFYMFFAFPFTIPKIRPFLKLCYQRRIVTVAALGVICLIVHFNTVVHPYLLADNRHFTFYIWNRLYGKLACFKYVMCVPYLFAMYSFCYDIYVNNNFGMFITFLPCIIIQLILQKMLEVRYFLLPFIIMRINLTNIFSWQLSLEFIFYLTVNAVSFYIFFTKDIIWNNFEHVQRLMW